MDCIVVVEVVEAADEICSAVLGLCSFGVAWVKNDKCRKSKGGANEKKRNLI